MVAESPLAAILVRNLPTKSAGTFGLKAMPTHPTVPMVVKAMKHFRLPIMLEMMPPTGQMQIANAMYMAAEDTQKLTYSFER